MDGVVMQGRVGMGKAHLQGSLPCDCNRLARALLTGPSLTCIIQRVLQNRDNTVLAFCFI